MKHRRSAARATSRIRERGRWKTPWDVGFASPIRPPIQVFMVHRTTSRQRPVASSRKVARLDPWLRSGFRLRTPALLTPRKPAQVASKDKPAADLADQRRIRNRARDGRGERDFGLLGYVPLESGGNGGTGPNPGEGGLAQRGSWSLTFEFVG